MYKCTTELHLLLVNPHPSVDSLPQIKFSWYDLHDVVPGEERYKFVALSSNELNESRENMCFFAMKNRMFMAGGTSYKNGTYTTDYHSRMFEIQGQRVQRLTDLTFPMDNGLCVAVNDAQALLCSSYTLAENREYECWNFDGGVSIRSGRTNDNHYLGGIANYRDGAIIISGEKNDAGSSEIYDPILRDWRMHPFPYTRFQKFTGFSSVGFYDKVYVFGGSRSNIQGESTVFRMAENLHWEEYR